MKKLIMATTVAACIALCAAVWPRSKEAEETSVPTPTPAVCATEATVAELKAEVETAPSAEKEKFEVPQLEPLHETIREPDATSMEIPAAPEAQPAPEPEPTPESVLAQTVIDPQPGDMVYVEGFGWLECQEPGEITYAEDMYENGNKIGSMG